jgi:predicted aspartyl protease
MTDFASLESVAEAGEHIYAEQYRAQLETAHVGEFVAIHVKTGTASVAVFSEQALTEARKKAVGPFHLMRIGSPSTFTVSTQKATIDTCGGQLTFQLNGVSPGTPGRIKVNALMDTSFTGFLWIPIRYGISFPFFGGTATVRSSEDTRVCLTAVGEVIAYGETQIGTILLDTTEQEPRVGLDFLRQFSPPGSLN